MGLEFGFTDGQTPLAEEEREGLRIPAITNREELNELEQQNIEQALQWTIGKSLNDENIFTESFIRMLHKRMFNQVWFWAGEFRKTNKNIGIDHWLIPTELRIALDDVAYWHKHKTYTPDEIALRFKHRIVSIHCFPNGNGRHSRLLADIVIEKIYNLPVFSWGAYGLVGEGNIRTAYLHAVKAADNGDYSHLLKFARF